MVRVPDGNDGGHTAAAQAAVPVGAAIAGLFSAVVLEYMERG
jgi:hypothetical protein